MHIHIYPVFVGIAIYLGLYAFFLALCFTYVLNHWEDQMQPKKRLETERWLGEAPGILLLWPVGLIILVPAAIHYLMTDEAKETNKRKFQGELK